MGETTRSAPVPLEVIKIPFQYDATILRVVDGDTVDVVLSRTVDFGFNIIVTQAHTIKLRLYGINAPEMKTAGGPPAKAHLIALLSDQQGRFLPAVIQTRRDRTEKYGRYLATILVNGASVNGLMVADGFAVSYFP